jgi:hypothetical protein
MTAILPCRLPTAFLYATDHYGMHGIRKTEFDHTIMPTEWALGRIQDTAHGLHIQDPDRIAIASAATTRMALSFLTVRP